MILTYAWHSVQHGTYMWSGTVRLLLLLLLLFRHQLFLPLLEWQLPLRQGCLQQLPDLINVSVSKTASKHRSEPVHKTRSTNWSFIVNLRL